ncbi:Protoheme IX farnesyltransferase [Buchnera aphidicola (Cinara kochiana kochiana)]|uniref:Protoheme IX farnesyltransferase n=1 Tax=Buchnera aphidicola (Cinara kochiana kochiana) TaxID=2518976 RepID=A0A451D5R8_9GAMM|nr:protoheme IX farnesyltransferase [Buchnera aphidicola]VFP81200.1 Protoheme IX farnesyltransferase [Buchnera aphidicola (Cinara kochiana kochiana)]
MDFRSLKSLILKFFFIFNKNNLMSILELIKPGIVLGNLISLFGGFFLASRSNLVVFLLIKVIFGIFLVISASCILNNIIDRNIDKKMNRTKNRILCTNIDYKIINILFVLAFFFISLGFFIFYQYINFISMIIAMIGVFFYVFIYSLFLKKKSCYSTLIGSISGSVPPIIGYVTINNKLNGCCLILFFIFIFWQIAHAYSIIIYRNKDYNMANIPTIVTVYSFRYTKICISICIMNMFFCNLLLYYFCYVHFFYFFCTSFFIFLWFVFSIVGNMFFYSCKKWSRTMFFISIFVIFLVSLMLSLNFLITTFFKSNYY